MATEDEWPSRHSETLRCPTCGARQDGPADTCRRCKSDLRLLRAALAAHDRHWRAALRLLDQRRPGAALEHAAVCHELRPGADSRRLLALCRLLRGDWPEALELARSALRAAHRP